VEHLVRGGRLVLASLAVAGCAREAPLTGVGYSPPRVDREAPLVDASSTAPAPSATRAGMHAMSDRFTSHGHGDAFDAVVWANEAGRAALESGADAAEGAVIVEETVPSSARGDSVRGELAMEKRAGKWRFSVVEADADAATPAAASACEGCHRDAPRDDVFALPPRVAAQMKSAASSAAITATAPTAVATPAATYDASSAGLAASPSSR
jgi:hypothetical protein